jgi:hypothetical protein
LLTLFAVTTSIEINFRFSAARKKSEDTAFRETEPSSDKSRIGWPGVVFVFETK